VPLNYYPQKSKDELLAILADLQKRGAGGILSQVSSLGSQQIRSFQGSGPVDREIRRVLYSLFLIDPENYTDPGLSRVRRVRQNYIA
jgi:hypothetical protein